MSDEFVTEYRINKAVNRMYDYTSYDIRPAIEDKIVFDIAVQALYRRDEDPHPAEIDERGFEIATWQGLTRLQLSQAFPLEEVSAKGQDLRIAFEEMGFGAQLESGVSLEGDAPY